MTPERLEELRALRIDGPLPHPIVIRDELLAEIDRLRGCSRGRKVCDMQIDELEKERDQLKAENEYLRSNTSSVVEREANRQLRSQLAVAREALGYYSNRRIQLIRDNVSVNMTNIFTQKAKEALEKLSGGEK